MPYEILPLKNGKYVVYNSLTGSVNSKHTTLEKAKAQIRLLHSKGYITGKEHPKK